jgi:CheY-like chemotaxis protein
MNADFRVVVIEDSPDDLHFAARIFDLIGIRELTSFERIPEALLYLEEIAAGARSCPDLILLDLNLGNDSGFEVLRFYKSNPNIQHCQIIVWTASGGLAKELCNHFGVECIDKEEGEGALETALRNRVNKTQ